MNRLKYRRQFLLTPKTCTQLKEWNVEQVASSFLYVHPDCQFEKATGVHELYLVGYFLDPHSPEKTPKEILASLAELKSIEEFPHNLYSLVGRFVLIIKTENDLVFFNDACGLRTFYYTRYEDDFYAASQPLLLNEVVPLKLTDKHDEYFNSKYVAKTVEHWVPSGVSFYEDVYHLVPNHYVEASELDQKRYYPFRKLKEKNYDEAVEDFYSLLKKTVQSANNNLDLTFSLTSGWDSRIILSSCKDFIDEVTFYSLKYRDMDNTHKDIETPRSLSKSLSFEYNVFDCQRDITSEFQEVYEANTDMAHTNDWGEIAYGMSKSYPEEKVAVKGSCAEIGRCFYAVKAKHSSKFSAKDFLKLEYGWGQIEFIRAEIEKWSDELSGGNAFNYDMYDLFYWEHKMGSWQAQSQLEWDIVQEVFTPFNSRELLDLMLSINPDKRKKHNPVLYVDTMKNLWKPVLDMPVNPLSLQAKVRRVFANVLRYFGLRQFVKQLVSV